MKSEVMIVMPSATRWGGAEEALSQIVAHRDSLPFQLSLVFLETGEMAEQMLSSGVPCTVIPAGRLRSLWRVWRTIRELRRVISRRQPKAVVGWMNKAHIYGGAAARLAKVPAICFQMGLPDKGRVDRVARLIPGKGTLTCSEFAAVEQCKVVRGPVIGVPLGMDDQRFGEQLCGTLDAKRSLGFDVDRPLIGIVGRLQRWKGIHIYLEAMAEVMRTRPAIQGVVVGGPHDLEPGYLSYLEAESTRLGLDQTVRFAGAQRNAQEWMQAMDVVVHASDKEPFGIVVVEAMALGKPVIASVPGGPAEIITDGDQGLLVPSLDPQALASAIRRFLDDPAFAAHCGAAARERSREFAASRFVRRFADAVESLLELDRSPDDAGAPVNC